jgi:hypothetical protein
MTTPSSQHATPSSETCRKELADYFGLLVRVIFRMEHYSLVQYGECQFVVNTEDLYGQHSLRCAA